MGGDGWALLVPGGSKVDGGPQDTRFWREGEENDDEDEDLPSPGWEPVHSITLQMSLSP